jgi:hypothetical protein
VGHRSNTAMTACSLIKEVRVEERSFADWRPLESFHYRRYKVPAQRKILGHNWQPGILH